jgi:alpha-glucosidase (family GH31 glycosyl hydrolase)
VAVRLRDLDDHFFGVLEMLAPDNRRSPDLRGAVIEIEAQRNVKHFHENFASVWSAFYMTARGYAAFFDTFAKGRYTFGVGGETLLYHRTGSLDWYLFFGDDGDALLSAYYRVIGEPKAPPMWALGPIGWREGSRSVEGTLEDVRCMNELKVPFTAWSADGEHLAQVGSEQIKKDDGKATVEKARSAIAALGMVHDLRVITGIEPTVVGDRNKIGNFLSECGYVDFSDSGAVAEFEARLSRQYQVAVRGHRSDGGEDGFSCTERWQDATALAERRNRYVYLYAKTVHNLLTEVHGVDHCNFARAAYHRSQPYLSAVRGGDARASWDGLGGNLANALRCGFMGFPVWGSDIGGHGREKTDEELYMRWLQWGVWSGLFVANLGSVGGESVDRAPWHGGSELQAAFREACAQRMRLLPYVFSLAQTSGRTGVLMKPLAYVWPDDQTTHAIGDEYMFGHAFLVAPITKPGGQRRVYFPRGDWYDFYNPSREYDGGGWSEVVAPRERIPVFVRMNSLFVTGSVALGNRREWEPALKPAFYIHAAPGKSGERVEFELADSFDGNKLKRLSLNREGATVRAIIPALGAGGELRVRERPPMRFRVNGRVTDVKYDPALAAYRISFAAGSALEVEAVPSGGERRAR